MAQLIKRVLLFWAALAGPAGDGLLIEDPYSSWLLLENGDYLLLEG